MSINVEAEKRAYQKFITAGMTPAGACGLIGNLEAESDGFYPSRVEYLCLKRLKESGKIYTDESYVAAIDRGIMSCEDFLHPLPGRQYGFGLAQWTSPGRKAGLWALAKQKEVSIADEDMQIEYLLKELSGFYPGVLEVLKTATSIRAASDVVLKKFEIPADTGETVCAGRAARGQRFYDEYVKGDKTVHYISNCGHDERGHYSGGKAGDQTGTEWALIGWYNRPWNCVLRHPDAAVRQLHADMAKAAAENDCIGYDQGQRDTFGVELKKAGDDPAKIKSKCETDCSKGIIDITKAIGRKTGNTKLQNIAATYTGNMRQAYKAAGYQVLTESKYLAGPDYLLPGDILLNDAHHTATNITRGGKAVETMTAPVSKDYLEKGDTGTAVKTMQLMLIETGYSCGPSGADGDFGSNTDKALRAFQKASGLVQDGKYGPKSKAKLVSMHNTNSSGKKSVDELAKEVIAGKWGNGDERKKKLIAAGYDYAAIQRMVNKLLK